MSAQPPLLLRRLLEAIAPEEADGLLGDLHEEFEELARSRGTRQARTWYRRQAFGSVLPLLRLRLLTSRSRALARACTVGAFGYLTYLALLYLVLRQLAAPGLGPLASLSPALFLFAWVFDASVVGAFLAALALGPEERSLRSTVVGALGMAGSALLVFGIDESLSAGHVLLLTAVTFGGAGIGAGLTTLFWAAEPPTVR